MIINALVIIATPSITGHALDELPNARKMGIAPAELPPTSRFERVPGDAPRQGQCRLVYELRLT